LAALLLFGKEASIAAHVPYCESISMGPPRGCARTSWIPSATSS
jgi:hypothetical protein